jgi:hypothetical protein
MGNHDVGRAMDAAAKVFWVANGDSPVSQEKAIAVLDAAAENFHGADAEFDDSARPGEPLGRLMAVAFGPWTESDEKANEDGERWYQQVYRPFRERYRFC